LFAFGTYRTIAALEQFVRDWTNNGQRWALARDASVTTIEFFEKKKSFCQVARPLE
jgi:hypothetical protein